MKSYFSKIRQSSCVKYLFFISIFFIFCCYPVLSKESNQISKEKIVLGGGPVGGTFQIVVNAINSFKPIKDAGRFKIQIQNSEGSIENIKKIDSGSLQMGIVYAGDLWRSINSKTINYTKNSSGIINSSLPAASLNSTGSNSNPPNLPNSNNKVMAVASLYTSAAQLVVNSSLDIKNIKELEGKKVGVGNIGSGSYSTCELFFTHLGLWDKIDKRGIGYNDAARAFKNIELDAFWIFSAAPCSAVAMAAGDKADEADKNFENSSKNININNQKGFFSILNIGDDAYKSGFLKEFPWFSTTMIKNGTYRGVEQDIISFQDYAILAASSDLSSDAVYQILSILYTDEGLKHFIKNSPNLSDISIDTGIIGIITPLHIGAERFWKEKGSKL